MRWPAGGSPRPTPAGGTACGSCIRSAISWRCGPARQVRHSGCIWDCEASPPGSRGAYLVPMFPALQSMVAVTYVRDIGASRAFYLLLGFREQRAGQAETSAWCALEHGDQRVLLTSTRPPLRIPPLPLLFYFFYDDLEPVLSGLTESGVE